MGKIRAFLIHLFASVAVVGAFLLMVGLVWYPAPHLELSGVFGVITVLILVDIVLGPLLMLLVFKPGKPGLKTDLAIIFSVQIVAFLYGANTIYSQRPAYVVFVVDRFEVVSAAELKMSATPPRELQAGIFSGPVLVYSNGPDDPVERGRIMLDAASGGPDVCNYPQYYKPYHGAVREVLAHVRPAQKLIESAGISETAISDIVGQNNADVTGYIPVIGREKVMSMLINPLTATPMGALDVEVW